MLTTTAVAAGCSQPTVSEEDEAESGNLAATEGSPEADKALRELTHAVGHPDQLTTVEVYGSEDKPTRAMAIVSKAVETTNQKAKGLDHDPSRVVYMHGQTFAYFDASTGGIAIIGNPDTEEDDVAAMKADLGGKDKVREPAGGIAPLAGGSSLISSSMATITARFLPTLARLVRQTTTQALKEPLTQTAELASATAKAVATAVERVPSWAARKAKAVVSGSLILENVDWALVSSKLSALGTKSVYLGDDGAKAYLKSVANERPLMVMTHSGKLSDARLADPVIGNALRSYVERAEQHMPEVLRLIAKRENAATMLGGGTLEGGQVVAYRAAAKEGLTVDSVMSGKGVEYVIDGKVAPSRNVIIQGADWGGESELATSAAKVGFLWGGGDQALQESLRLLASGKPVYVIREANALSSVAKMPNAAADLTVDKLPAGTDKSLLHVFETWEDAIAALKGGA